MWELSHLLSIASFALALVFVSQVLRERRPPGSTVAWLLVMFLIPYLGVPLYFIFGGRKLLKTAKLKEQLYKPVSYSETPQEVPVLERILLSSGVPAKTSGNSVKLLGTATEAYLGLLKEIENARASIHITSFILSGDEVGRSVIQALSKKAREGVHVKVLIDGFGSFWLNRLLLKDLRKAGGEIEFFMPLLPRIYRAHFNLRNHRKLVVIDGSKVIVGGMNIKGDYMGPSENQKQFKDLSILMEGPVAAQVDHIFRSDWKYATGKALKPAVESGAGCSSIETDTGAHVSAQVVANGPDVHGDPLYDSIVSAIFDAHERVWVATPYFIPDETLARALELAGRRGVDVRVLVPKRSNHLLADLCRRSYMRQVTSSGGHVHFYLPGMMHGKLILIDDAVALVGSANLDMRSLFLNYELGVYLYSSTATRILADWFSALLLQSSERKEESRSASLLLDGVGRILGPIV